MEEGFRRGRQEDLAEVGGDDVGIGAVVEHPDVGHALPERSQRVVHGQFGAEIVAMAVQCLGAGPDAEVGIEGDGGVGWSWGNPIVSLPLPTPIPNSTH